MSKAINTSSNGVMAAFLSALLIAGVLTLAGCSEENSSTGPTTDTDYTMLPAELSIDGPDGADIEGTMQLSTHMINLQSVGAAESVRAIVGLSIPGGYHLTDYDFTLSFNGEDVADAYDCYYCYIDDNLIISFRKSEIIASPVTGSLVNTEAVAAVNGFFRVESEDDGYDTSLSTVANVEIMSPSNSDPVPKYPKSAAGI